MCLRMMKTEKMAPMLTQITVHPPVDEDGDVKEIVGGGPDVPDDDEDGEDDADAHADNRVHSPVDEDGVAKEIAGALPSGTNHQSILTIVLIRYE